MNCSPLDTTTFLPRRLHETFKMLGRHDWLRVIESAGGRCRLKVGRPALDAALREVAPAEGANTRAMLRHLEVTNPAILLSVRAVASLLHHGPEVFRPAASQCQACEETRLDFSPAQWRQAHSAVIVIFPPEYARQRNLPPHVLIYHHAADGQICTHAGRMIGDPGGLWLSGVMTGSDQTIEAKLARPVGRGESGRCDWTLAQRVALACTAKIAGRLG